MKTRFIFFNGAMILMVLLCGNMAVQAQNVVQSVIIEPSFATLGHNTFLRADVLYDVSDNDKTLTGIEVRFHYAGSLLSIYADADNLEPNGTVDNTPQDDLNDYDNDTSTDKYITVSYEDASGAWPGTEIDLPYKICDIEVYPYNITTNTNTSINVSFISTASGYTGSGWPCAITLCDVNTAFSVNGVNAPDIDDPNPVFPSVLPNSEVTFSAVETPEQTTTLSWDFDYGGTAHSSYSTNQEATHTYTAVGEYQVNLLLSNSVCSMDGTTKINVCGVKASFEYPGNVFVGDEIQFNNTSEGNAGGWHWDFSGHGSSSAENPSFTFSSEGEKTVTLTAYGGGTSECSSTAAAPVYVYACGVSGASFTHDAAPPDYKTAGETVNFTNTSTYTTDESYIAWKWDFGDDNISYLKNPFHVYSAPGTYAVTLEAADNATGNEIPCVKTTGQDITIVEPGFDSTPPVITLLGSPVVNVIQGRSYYDAGASAYDDQDGDLTSDIITYGLPVNTNAHPGTSFTIRYNVTDSSGNAAQEVVRTVNIIEAPDTTPPVITLNGSPEVEAVRGSVYSDAGASAHDNRDGDITSRIVVTGLPVDTGAPSGARFTIRYNVRDKAGNQAEEVVRTVTIVEPADTVPPVLTLNGSPSVNAPKGFPYSDAGASAYDNRDGDITSRIVVTGFPVNTNAAVGTQFTIRYNVSDEAGNKAEEVVRTVMVTAPPDTTPPVITLLGDFSPEVVQGGVYSDAGAGAVDDEDGDITSQIVVTGLPVDTSAPVGTQTAVRYNVSDSAGNQAEEVVRTVTIIPASDNTAPNRPSGEIPENEHIFPIGTKAVLLCAGPFFDPDGDVHRRSRWFVRRADRVYGCADYHPSFDAENVSGDLTCHTVSGLETGLKYYWKVEYWDDRGAGSVSRELAFKIGKSELSEVVRIEPGVSEADARMISVFRWPDLPQIQTSLGDEIGDYDITLFRIAAYDPIAGDYVEYGPDLDLIPGRAYWILSRYGLDYAFDGVNVSMVHDMEVELRYNPDIPDGWNMIACPNKAAYDWEDVRVLQYGKNGDIVFGPVSISNIDDENRYVDKRLRRWQDGAYSPDTELMLPGRGYWVKALAENVYLRFLADNMVYLPDVAQNRNRTGQSGANLRNAADVDDHPPDPPGGFDLSEFVDSNGGGCFMEAVDF